MSSIESKDFLTDHGLDAGIGMISRSSPCSTADSFVEAFQATGGTKVSEMPGGVITLDEEIGNGLTEVSAQGLDSSGLCETIGATDLEITTQHGVPAFSLVDSMEVLEDAFFASASLLGRKLFILDVDGMIDIAQFVEETALLLSSEVDSAQCRAQATTAIMDDELQSVLASNPLLFQDAEKGDPLLVILTTAQPPEQDLRPVAVRPNTHGNEDRTLEAAFHYPFATFSVATHLPIRTQLRHPDSVHLQNRRHLL